MATCKFSGPGFRILNTECSGAPHGSMRRTEGVLDCNAGRSLCLIRDPSGRTFPQAGFPQPPTSLASAGTGNRSKTEPRRGARMGLCAAIHLDACI
jgi:hypothetical protein